MAETSVDKTWQSRFNCVSVILCKYVGCDSERTKHLAFLLRDDSIISKDERLKLQEILKEEGNSAAVDKIIEHVGQHNLSYFVTALKDDDLKVDPKVSEVLEAILNEEFNNDHVSLISLWDELEKYREDLKQIILEIWPDEVGQLTDRTNWPLHFIHFCTTSKEKHKLDDFLRAATFLAPQVDTGDEDFTSTVYDLKDDSPESFVILDMDEPNQSNENEMSTKLENPNTSSGETPDIFDEIGVQVLKVSEEDKSGKESIPSSPVLPHFEIEKPQKETKLNAAEVSASLVKDTEDESTKASEVDQYTAENFSSSDVKQDIVPAELPKILEEKEDQSSGKHASSLHVQPNTAKAQNVTKPNEADVTPHCVEDKEENTDVLVTEVSSTLSVPYVEETLTWSSSSSNEHQEWSSSSSNEHQESKAQNVTKPNEADVTSSSVEDKEENTDVLVTEVSSTLSVPYVEETLTGSSSIKNEHQEWSSSSSNEHQKSKAQNVTKPNEADVTASSVEDKEENADVLVTEVSSTLSVPYVEETLTGSSSIKNEHQESSDSLIQDGNADSESSENEIPIASDEEFDAESNEENERKEDNVQPGGEENQYSEEFVLEQHQIEMLMSGNSSLQVSPCAPVTEDVVPQKRSSSVDVPYTVEFRVFPTKLPTAEGRVCIILYDSRHLMEKHWLGYYFCNLEIKGAILKYLYAYEYGKKIKRESLPLKAIVRQRSITGGTIVQDVACFSKISNVDTWRTNHLRTFSKFLPHALAILNKNIPLGHEIYVWLHNLKIGWNYKFKHDISRTIEHRYEDKDVERELEGWLSSVSQLPDTDVENHLFVRVLCCLAVIKGFKSEKHIIERKEMLMILCLGLQTHRLDKRGQIRLYNRISSEFQLESDSDHPLHEICKSLENFFKAFIKLGGVDIIFLVSLYWLIYEKGNFKDQLKYDMSELILTRAILPELGEKHWTSFKQCISNLKPQSKLKQLNKVIENISHIHPRIVDTYQFFLTPTSLIDLLLEKVSIGEKFQLDSVLCHILPLLDPITYTTSASKKLAEYPTKILKLSSYLSQRFSDMMKPEYLRSLQSEDKLCIASSSARIMKELFNALSKVVNGFKFDDSEREQILWIIQIANYNASLHNHVKEMGEKGYEALVVGYSIQLLDLIKLRISEISVSRNRTKNSIDTEEIKFYNDLLKFKWPESNFDKHWQGVLLIEMKDNIDEKWCPPDQGQDFLNFYLNYLKDIELVDELDLILEKKAEEYSDRAFSESEVQHSGIIEILIHLVKQRSDKSVKMMLKLFEKEFNKCKMKTANVRENSLRFLLKSPFPLRFFRIVDVHDKKLMKKFGTSTKSCVIQVTDVLFGVLHELQQKDVVVSLAEFDWMLEQKDRMMELLVIFRGVRTSQPPVQSSGKVKDKEFEMMFKAYEKTVSSYYEKLESLKTFINLCKSFGEDIKVDCGKLESIYGADKRKIKLCKLYDNFITEDEIYNISDITMLHGSEILNLKLQEIAHQMLSKVRSSELTEGKWKLQWRFVLNEIWPRTKEKLGNFLTHLNEATMDQDTLLENMSFTDGDEENIKNELEILYKYFASPKNRKGDYAANKAAKMAKSITYAFEIQKGIETINWILDFKKTYNLCGDFSAISKFQGKFQDTESEDFEKMRPVLQIEKKNLKILKTFVQQQALITWLRSKMKDENDVRGLCMVAMESTRHEPMQADKWLFLSDAVAGFESLIFHLDRVSGLKGLIKRCKRVWRNVESDETLLTKWADAGKETEWFKANEQWYGSEDKAVLCYAQETNRRGLYTIGNILKNNVNFASLKESIKLHLTDIPASKLEGNNESDAVKMNAFEKNADIDYLHDVESKLMLISGDGTEGQKDVQQFQQLLNAAESLAQAYVDLVNAGFMLFNDWNVEIGSKHLAKSDMMTEHILTLRIAFKQDIQSLNKSANIQDINLLADILKDVLKRWNGHVKSMRLKHYFLNDYSIQQIKYLCEQLGKMRQSGMEDCAYILLSDLTRQEMNILIQESLNQAMIIDDVDEDHNNEVLEDDLSDENVSHEVLEKRNKRRAVRLLVNEENVSEQLAKAAVQVEGHDDISACSNWMLLHEYDIDLVEDRSQAFDQSTGFIHDQSDIKEDISILHDRSTKTLESIIKKLQESQAANTENGSRGYDILRSIKTICMRYLSSTTTLTLKDYLSVNHLGKFLTILHNKMGNLQGNRGVVIRNTASTIKQGSPNFILCQEEDIIPSLLSLYKTECDVLLPTHPEVLLCCEETTSDQVERFLLRAMCKMPTPADPLFCLAYAHKLDLNVSKSFETMYDDLTRSGQHVRDNYQLVIISSNPQHYLTARFEKFQIEKFPQLNKKDIQEYASQGMSTDTGHKIQTVTSTRSGVGKSLHIKKIFNGLDKSTLKTTVRLLEKNLDVGKIIKRLYSDVEYNEQTQYIHFDLTPAVEVGIDKFMFDLLVLGMITDSSGKVWRRRRDHTYYIEMKKQLLSNINYSHTLNLLQTTECIPPLEVLENLQNNRDPANTVLINEKELNSDVFQRPYQYLRRLEKKEDITSYKYNEKKALDSNNHVNCIDVLLRYCGINNPSWGQLKYFASFLNMQLISCERSEFCQMMEHELKGLKDLAVKFMIRMSQDFATPSLVISDQSTGNEDIFSRHQIRRKWEENEHPYLFFNEDRISMTFINVDIDQQGNLLNKDKKIIEKGITSKELVAGLCAQRIKLGHNFHTLSRHEMIEKLSLIMGVDDVFDPDPTYELTTDNVLKIIAIYMRFRCRIPVVIMGETGCGKTRMIEFMNSLLTGRREKQENRMDTLKIHGGIDVEDIYKSVHHANESSVGNSAKDKILFYDEANTTTAIYAIKEVMCDATIDGRAFNKANLRIVAACNPYKQLSPQAIKKLEASGLGYRVSLADTNDRLGNIAMRTLVYRVVALPPSIQPFVWDFGQLSDGIEETYIEKMTDKLVCAMTNLTERKKKIINIVLSSAHIYMKKQQDECRFVSLRDVERTLKLFKWFMQHKDIFPKIDKELERMRKSRHYSSEKIFDSLRSLLHALNITYHVSLENRKPFRDYLSSVLKQHDIDLSSFDIYEEFIACQTVFHHGLKTVGSIAWNEALRENVYLMTVCADAKLPLYLIGKPGSSKSLAKTIVEANMKGSSSRSDLFKKFKKMDFLTYQCSALTKANGIEKIFTSAAQRQRNKDLNKFSALVVLDEIGLAEDSPDMPLKILHPLLECGSATNGTLTDFDETKLVSFIGISNWALDPAKMNRGVFVTRNNPDEDDLCETAKGLFCESQNKINEYHTDLENLTKTYLDVYDKQEVSYFGLRDYYNLIKMLHKMSKEDRKLGSHDFSYILLRNFGGGSDKHLEILKAAASKNLSLEENFYSSVSLKTLLTDNLKSFESRFLLLLTSEHSSVNLLHHILPNFDKSVKILFGSSFPGDHSYTWFCRIINQIKVCMETGLTVVLLNFSTIHESLYDVLNQHFVQFGGQNYVALGLGSHRVWSRIHENFRIIIVEKREIVQDRYPIALINRLEKHHLLSESLLITEQQDISKELHKWSQQFSNVNGFDCNDAFVGVHADTTGSVVLAFDGSGESPDVLKKIMLDVATADAVLRLPKTSLQDDEKKNLLQIYMKEQSHDCLFSLLYRAMSKCPIKIQIFEIVSFSNILTEEDRKELETKLNLVENSVMLLSLQQFKVEQEYIKYVVDFFVRCSKDMKKKGKNNVAVLLIQIAQAQRNGQLIECAKHYFMNELNQISDNSLLVDKVLIGFLLCTERGLEKNFNRYNQLIIQHTKKCRAIYVDELRHAENNMSTTLISSVYSKSIKDILLEGKQQLLESSEQSHVLCLLKDCICDSMSRLTGQKNMNGRELQCIEILQRIFQDWSSSYTFKEFLRLLFERMIMFENSSQDEKMQWLTSEASSVERLREGGTFGKTIHIKLKQCFANMLAYIVSVIDENNNLSILISSEEEDMDWRPKLWLQIFSIINMEQPSHCRNVYSVKVASHLRDNFDSNFPFSFAVNQRFLHLYDASKNHGKREEFFYHSIQKSTEREIVAVREMWNSCDNFIKVMQAYAFDVVKFLFAHGTDSKIEYEGLVKILLEFSYQKLNRQKKHFDGISITFFTFMQHSEQLEIISNIFKMCPECVANIDQWIETQKTSTEFVIHQLALDELLDLTNNKADKINDVEKCIAWLSLASQMKKAFHSVISSTESQERKKELEKKWKPVALLDMLLMHLLPGSDKMKGYANFVNVIVKQAIRMFSGVRRMGFNSFDVLKITSVILRKCYENLKLNIMMNWGKPGCISCGRIIQVPIKMPCNEYICEDCATRIRSNDLRQCPHCQENLPENFTVSPPKLTESNRDELIRFKNNCTSFFLEYLHTFCFEIPHASDQEKKIRIFKDIFASSDSREQKQLKTTALNLDIEFKSSVFQLLYKLSPEFLETEFNKLLAQGGKPDEILIFSALKGFEDICNANKLTGNVFDRSEELLRKSWHTLSENHEISFNFKILKNVAELRISMINLVTCIEERSRQKHHDELTRHLILSFGDICRHQRPGFLILKKFVTKMSLLLHGKHYVTDLCKNEEFSQILLKDEIQSSLTKMSDPYALLGEDYVALKQSLSNKSKQYVKTIEDHFPQDENIFLLQNIPKILAVMNCGNKSVKTHFIRKLRNRPHKSSLLTMNILNEVTSAIEPSIKHDINQLVMLVVCVVSCKPYLLQDEAYNLIFDPQSVVELFWPAMPESLHNAMVGILQNEAPYTCPNGHVYYIGECRRPWDTAKCPECNESIGGSYHVPSQGNDRMDTGEKSQCGYQLYYDKKGVDNPGDRITEHGSETLQFILHSCMIFALQEHADHILRMIHVDNVEQGQLFLMQKLQKNLENLSYDMGRSIDDGILILHLILKRIIDRGQHVRMAEEHQPDWKTMVSRKEWEKEFHSHYLLPVFSDIERLLSDAQNELDQANIANASLNKLLDETSFQDDIVELSSFHPLLWKSIKHSNSSHLLQCIADSNSGKVLQNILQTPSLHLVQYLSNTLKLQDMLIQRYQNNYDIRDLESKTFSQVQASETYKNGTLINEYIKLWNEIYPTLKQKNSSDIVVQQYMKKISVASPITMALPSLRGRGKCAKLLSEYLIDIQNDFLIKCKDVVDGVTEVDVSKLMSNDFVRIDKHKDLLPMIQLHTAYSITENELSRRHHITYNIDALEKQAKEKFVVYKKMIRKKTLPCIKYSQDIGIGSDWDEVKNTVTQSPLPSSLSNEVNEMIERSTLADVCEGVRTLTQAISFLAKIGAKPTKKLRDYLEKDLMLATSHLSMIPKSAQIQHALALYQKLSCHKAVCFVQQGIDPYKECLQEIEQTKIEDQEMLDNLKTAFEHMDVASLQHHINEMLIKVPDFKPSWSLRFIFPSLEFIEDQQSDTWYSQIPVEVRFQHVSDLFRLSVQGFDTPTLRQATSGSM